MKFAFLIMYEIRSLKKIENLYKYIINYYNCDLFICCQELDNTNEKLKLFENNVISKRIYKKINPKDYYNNQNLGNYNQQNWNNNNCLQIYINWNEMANDLEQHINNYDYFILLRTDIDILFNLPDKDFFENIPNAIYSFEAQYAKNFGGYSTGVFVHRNYILNYLRCTYNVLKNDSIIQQFLVSYDILNQENFKNFCMKYNNLVFKYIKNLNIFFICDDLNTRSTWGTPQTHHLYDGVIKERNQFEEAYNNLQLWNNGYRWKYKNDYIELCL
jgi:hypothetical protein